VLNAANGSVGIPALVSVLDPAAIGAVDRSEVRAQLLEHGTPAESAWS
jgi:hypothetical protein